jgi:hypothetical protein
MIHRIDRVNPDVDDRVIKPNEARMAVNLRFGASTEDTNLSGGTLVLGNTELPFTPPAGTNKVVGVYADLESRNVFFALYNNQGENTAAQHGIYRISGTDNSVQPIVQGAWLNFQSDDAYNVSITGVDGKLYWTDNVNEPRMVNVEKGIRTQAGDTTDVYPIAPVQDWFYSQIKRPPGQPLVVEPVLEADLPGISLTKQNKALTETGFQYSYYYVYDNFEESRLAPFSKNRFANYNVTLTIPQSEFENYCVYKTLITAIVIVVRNGNDGVWKEIKYHKNDGQTRVFVFPNILTSQKNTVASDITDARFDSVPLESTTNEIAQNKINHGNYKIDYNSVESLSITASIKRLRFTDIYDSTEYDYTGKSFVPWGRYSIGVELVDKFGRTQPVTAVSEVIAPWWLGDATVGTINQGPAITLQDTNVATEVNPNIIDERPYNYAAEYEISGDIPSWVDRVNIVRSKAKNIVQMIQSLGYMYLWYKNQEDGNEFFTWVNYGINPYIKDEPQNQWAMNQIYDGGSPNTKYTFQGYAIEFNTFEPITAGDNQYIYFPVTFTGDLVDPSSANNNDVYPTITRFKVHNVVGNKIFIKASEGVTTHPNYAQQVGAAYNLQDHILTPYTLPVACFNTTVGNFQMMSTIGNYTQLMYNFAITTETEADEQILYTTQKSYTASEYKTAIANTGSIKDYLYGDAYICLALKETNSSSKDIKIFNPGQVNGSPLIVSATQKIPAQGWYGWFVSMNPIDIYYQQWNQDIGQINTTNYKASQNRRLPSNICFSGSLVQGTQVNGLNKFNSLDFRQAPAENGPITSLVTTNATQREPGVLLAIGTYGVSSFYYDAIQLTNVDGTNNVTTTDSYLASQRPLLGQYGTSRPMSVTKTPLGTVYWWSDVVNDLIRYTNAGLERLGNTFSFANYLRRTYNENPLLITWYDQVTDEINLLGAGVRAAVFSERYKTFQGERDYFLNGITPERAIGLPTKQFWFVNGRVWMADVNQSGVDDNFIFGAYRNPNLTIITNESPAAVKRWNQVKVFGNRPSSTILSTTGFDTITDETLTSFIAPGYYIQRKGDWEAAIRRASNTEGGLLAGKLMESRIIYSNFAFNAEGFDKLNFIEIKSNVSIVQ